MLMNPQADEIAKVVAKHNVKVVTTGAGNRENIWKWKNAGIKSNACCCTVAMARMMERCGADAVIAEGTEAGGHIGEITTMVLVHRL